MYYVYAESVLAINFCVNFILLYVLAKINKRKFLILRSIASALIGAIYALIFVMNIKFFTYPAIKPILALLMVFIAVKKLNIKTFLLLSAQFFLLAFVCAGAVIGISNILGQKVQNIAGVIVSSSINTNKLLITISAVCAAVIVVTELYKNKHFYSHAQIFIKLNSEIVDVRAFADTGNLLKSISGKYIILVYKEYLKNHLNKYINCDIESALKDITLLENSCCKVTIVMCNTPAGSKKIICVKPEEIKIKYGNNIHDVSGDALIGILDEAVVGPDKSFGAIYNPIIISKGNICNYEQTSAENNI